MGKNKLYPHQKEGVRRALNQPFFALFMEQRTGKTPVAIRVMVKRYLRGGLHRLVVFAPKDLLYNWEQEFYTWADLPDSKLKILRLQGKRKAEWVEQIRSFSLKDPGLSISQKDRWTWKEKSAPLMVYLLNFEKARILEPLLKKLKIQGLIIDESQRVKSRNAQVSKAIYRITRKCSSRLLLSGTPIGKGNEDLFMQYQIMDPDIFGTNYHSFEEKYISKGGYMGKEIVGYKNEDEFKQIVADTSYRVLLKDCMKLPPLDHKYLSCELTGKALKAYQELYEDLYTQIPLEASRSRLKAILRKNHIAYHSGESYLSLILKAESFINVASCDLTITQLIRLHQMTGGFIKLDSGEIVQLGRDKLDLALEYLQGRTTPTVVFCNFVEEIRLLERELKKALPHKRIENYRDSKNRELVQRDFKEGKVDIIILQIHSGSVGLNFQRADAILFYSIGHSADDYSQAIARIKGPEQTHRMEVVDLLCEGTVDEDILEGLRVKLKRMKDFWKS